MRGIGIVGTALLVLMVGVASAATDLSPDPQNAALASKDQLSDRDKKNNEVIAMAERFGLIVGAVTEDVRKELNLRSAEGVAVFEVIGDSLADKAGIKVHAVIAEINKVPVRNLDDFGRLLLEALAKGNFTVGTWEPMDPENQGQGGQMNFHFVPKITD
jgi:membrane-associated protease RseP (regulator of RpoE activity)